jgi:hypothetical protein
MAGLYRLRVETGLMPGVTYPLEKAENIIGRDVACDVVLQDVEVSRRHAVIRLRNDICEIQDYGSTNGTYVNGELIESTTRLTPGDLIGLGETVKLYFELAVDLGQGRNDPPQKPEGVYPQPYPHVVRQEPALSHRPATSMPSGQPAAPPPMTVEGEPSGTIELPNPLPTQKPLPIWMLILLIGLVAVILFCGLPMFIIDITDSWCKLFGGVFNAIRPFTCP